MKKHLILMTAMLSFGITQSCESAVKAKNNGEACANAEECKSNVCTDTKCTPGSKKAGDAVTFLEECASQKASCKPDTVKWKDELAQWGESKVCERIFGEREAVDLELVQDLRSRLAAGEPSTMSCTD